MREETMVVLLECLLSLQKSREISSGVSAIRRPFCSSTTIVVPLRPDFDRSDRDAK